MKAPDVHALLLTCPAPLSALKAFGEEVASGKIEGTATVIYKRGDQSHAGQNAKLQRYWRRIEGAAQQGALWTYGETLLPESGQAEPVRLTAIEFDEEAVAAFVATRQLQKPKRGRKRIQDKWTPFWIAAAKLGKLGLLNIGTFPTQAALRAKLQAMMDSDLDEQTIKPFAALIYKQVVVPTDQQLQDDVTP